MFKFPTISLKNYVQVSQILFINDDFHLGGLGYLWLMVIVNLFLKKKLGYYIEMIGKVDYYDKGGRLLNLL